MDDNQYPYPLQSDDSQYNDPPQEPPAQDVAPDQQAMQPDTPQQTNAAPQQPEPQMPEQHPPYDTVQLQDAPADVGDAQPPQEPSHTPQNEQPSVGVNGQPYQQPEVPEFQLQPPDVTQFSNTDYQAPDTSGHQPNADAGHNAAPEPQPYQQPPIENTGSQQPEIPAENQNAQQAAGAQQPQQPLPETRQPQDIPPADTQAPPEPWQQTDMPAQSADQQPPAPATEIPASAPPPQPEQPAQPINAPGETPAGMAQPPQQTDQQPFDQAPAPPQEPVVHETPPQQPPQPPQQPNPPEQPPADTPQLAPTPGHQQVQPPQPDPGEQPVSMQPPTKDLQSSAFDQQQTPPQPEPEQQPAAPNQDSAQPSQQQTETGGQKSEPGMPGHAQIQPPPRENPLQQFQQPETEQLQTQSDHTPEPGSEATPETAGMTFQLPQSAPQGNDTYASTTGETSVPETPHTQQDSSTSQKSGWKHTFGSKAKAVGNRLTKIRFKSAVSAAAFGMLIFGVFNAQVILGQVQYLTTPSGGIQSTTGSADLSAPVGDEPRIIIPQIDVKVPVVYDEPSFEEEKVQKALERGVVHYGTTAKPGENGNVVIVGHSSNNWWNSGKYKFAFILLDKLQQDDEIVLHYQGTRYVYKVENKKVVEPTNTSVLNQTGNPRLTLITCTPPGTSWQRLVVQARQVTPDPSQNTDPRDASDRNSQALPSDSSSSFFEFVGDLF